MKYGRYGWSHLFMSWGVGIVFLWIGINIVMHPGNWLGYVPEHVPLGLSREHALLLNGILDIGVGVLLMMRWWQKLVALIATLHLAGILLFNGIDAVLIRDVGLLGASLALLTWPTHYKKHKWWKVWQRGSSAGDVE